jgi:glyoxylase-like metal-dependent hydrolase (beta-lactamase superfamily II)
MKVTAVRGRKSVYTSNVYLISGDWRRIEDVNALVDVGNDPGVLEEIQQMNVGVGKRKVERVILTHHHSDHTAILPMIRSAFNPEVLAYSQYMEGVDKVLKDGELVQMGDRNFEVLHTPEHTEDSVMLYCKEEGALFVGDSPVFIPASGGTYNQTFIRCIEKLCRRNIRTIYLGHGEPITQGAKEILEMSLKNMKGS